MKIKIVFIYLLFYLFNLSNAFSANFKNYFELSACVDEYKSFAGYRNKLNECFKNQGIEVNKESFKLIEKKSGIIDDIIELELPNQEVVVEKKSFLEKLKEFEKNLNETLNPDLDKIAQEENIFNKPSVFSDKYNEAQNFKLDDNDFSKLNKHIKKNPNDIYALTEDINFLTFEKSYLSEFKRQELLLNIYNSFDPLLFSSLAKTNVFNGISGGSQLGVLAVVGGIAAVGGGGSGGGGSGNSSPATLSFSVSASSLGECDAAITITGTLTKAHSSNVSISYSTGGTATSGTDYSLSATSSTIVAGSTSASITLTPVNDTTNETSETVILTASTSDVTTTGNTQTTITIYDYVLKCNSTVYSEDTSVQNTIVNRSSWTAVDQSSNNLHPYELVNLHKAHSFKNSSNQYLLGNGKTIYIVDDTMNSNHNSFQGKTVTMLDSPAVSNNSYDHGTHVASIAAGVISGTTHGVAPDASLVFSTFNNSGTDQATDIDTARNTHSAIVMNNSWGYENTGNTSAWEWNELVAAANASGRNIRQELDASGFSVFGSHTSTYITALDNFQNSGVIVWANSNFANDTDTSMMAGLPVYFNGIDDSVDLSDAWLSVMYAEFTGTTLSGASTSDFNRLGNPCGNAKEWCLVVDDSAIQAAGYVDAGGTSVYDTLQGSSMGAPQVSGMIALLGQAFPNHTPEQLTDRLLASANNAWFTPSGNTTFTVHGASIKHGYNDTWGHGVPDMYAALSPITTSLNPLSFGGGGGSGGGGSGGGGSSGGGAIPFAQLKKYPVSSTSITASSSLGNALNKGLENKFTYAYDALHGGFKLYLKDFIYTENLELQKIKLSLSDELENLKKYKFNNYTSENLFKGEYITFKNKFNYGTSITLDTPNLAIQNATPKNSFYTNPFLTENNGIGFNQKLYLNGNDLLISYNNSKINPLTNINKDTTLPIETLAVSLNLNNKSFDELSLTTGIMRESESFLLSKSSGAFGLNNNNLTNFFGFNLNKKINNNSSISFNNTTGISQLKNGNNNFIIGSSKVLSSSFEVDYQLDNIFGKDSFNFIYSQPNRIENGDMKFRIIGLSDNNGIIPYKDHIIELSPSGRQKDITLSYIKEFGSSLRLGLKTIITDDLGHFKQDKIDKNIIFTGSFKF